MKNTYLVLYLCGTLALVACSGSKQTTEPETSPKTSTESLLSYQDEITQAFLKKHLSVLADDSLEGRETGKPGQKKAAKYLAEQFKKMNLKPMGDDNSYLQKFNLSSTVSDSVVFETYRIEDNKRKIIEHSVASQNSTANYIRALGGTDTLDAEIVFAGFGVNDASHGVAHLNGVDIAGKWVLIFQQIPSIVNGDTLISPAINEQVRLRTIIGEHQARGVLFIPPIGVDQYQKIAKQTQSSFGEEGGLSLPYLENESNAPSPGFDIINPAMAALILGLDSAEDLPAYRTEVVRNITLFKATATGFGLKHQPYSHKKMVETENVLALIEGADAELKDEVVVLSAHYDHVGIGEPDSTGDRIYNGANDDGSGTIGLLSAAYAMAKARDNGIRPRRSVLFLLVSGEEKGLLGSRYYSDHPVIPMSKTVADINTDMIGRVDPEHKKSGESDYIYIIGSEIISSDMESLLQAGNARAGNLKLDKRYNDLNDPNQFYRRSDHWNFGRFGVPFVFFFNGVHEDYHRPSDEIEKIQFDLMAKTARTMYATTVLVANADEAPKVDNQEFIDITKGN